MTPFYARRKSTTLALATAVAAGALLTTGLTTGATAQPAPVAGKAQSAGAPVKLTPAARTALIKKADAATAETADEIGLGAKEELVVRDVLKDTDGTVHTRYERTFGGLPVLGGDLVVHESKAGTVKSVTRATKATVKVSDLTADVTKATAEKQALKAAKAEGSTKTEADKAPRKVVWAASGKPALAYETVVGGFQHDGTPQQLHVITDAETGKKLYEFEAIQTGTGNSKYNGSVTIGTTLSGSTYNLTDATRGNHKTYNKARATSSSAGTLFTDANDVWGTGSVTSSSTDQNAAVDAHYGAQVTWDFYKNVLGRNGIKNNGVAAYSRVHYGNAYVNAFWDDSCFCMTYGDGAGNIKPLTSLDVAGHEMSHGLTSNTAGLNYSGESGGLNEATSDIFGTAVEFYAANSTDVGDYLIGEKVDIRGNGTPLRYMDQPSKDGSSANYWSSSLGSLDVHYSSGPANHFFFLLSEGSGSKTINGVSYNSPTSNGATITGIGRAKAVQIWYKALSTYMTSTTNYKGARTATLNAASSLYGSSSAEYAAVNAAWAAVNVNA
ncbi:MULTISPECIES: M4 family metallopeptidase [Streptomyces]|uniref:Neutral metalloproteinase n=1 Tax=Streptomyces europaeiscabiei TaxID=146819 RepID=A0ABU4NQX3_9ACTN|nr:MULTISPECIES: M4 family metallopeptidase [Streptomyces]MDX2531126.1 M4 family metallopeptidase [Streptomyces europaeiscabiei]MDX2759253.1 M4 family metallopeptidase [Streptomyces europaeiscabiei]MDX2769566.1 M4 family metallopeptidase [Streptomyces europaeiscabiei]MDX3549938.1 M4 family metallopeptidase [Streptomyces europaeiscabiei]MDX3557379.1 M4 family metallopeptidase [Streptomyces europaeiscabiei]